MSTLTQLEGGDLERVRRVAMQALVEAIKENVGENVPVLMGTWEG